MTSWCHRGFPVSWQWRTNITNSLDLLLYFKIGLLPGFTVGKQSGIWMIHSLCAEKGKTKTL